MLQCRAGWGRRQSPSLRGSACARPVGPRRGALPPPNPRPPRGPIGPRPSSLSLVFGSGGFRRRGTRTLHGAHHQHGRPGGAKLAWQDRPGPAGPYGDLARDRHRHRAEAARHDASEHPLRRPRGGRAALHLALILGSGALLIAAAPGLLVLPAMLLMGIVQAALFAPFHETSHYTAFKSRRANAVVGWVAGLPALHNWHFYQQFHLAHHKHTWIRHWTRRPIPARRRRWPATCCGSPAISTGRPGSRSGCGPGVATCRPMAPSCMKRRRRA